MTQTLVVGDIHGCYDEFMALLDLAGLSSDDTIIALGDIVDRGPDSVKVIEFFRSGHNALSIMGNHEHKHIRSSIGEVKPSASQLITREQIGEADYPAALNFFRSFAHHIQLDEALLVHGFWEAGVALEEQEDSVLIGTLSGEKRMKRQSNQEWYTLYDGDLPLIVGHRAYNADHTPLIYNDRVYGLDTGCVYGGRLTGMLLPSFRIISVPSRGDHWTPLRKAYPQFYE
jgi:serine/threonine protein phosphatase 1